MTQNEVFCSDERIMLLFHDRLSDSESKQLYDHVEQCSDCQQRVESLAGTADDWKQLADALRTNNDTFGYWRQDRENLDAPIDWTESMAKKLLQPPTHPEMLGRLGRYEIERLIGFGGMGVVFKGYDGELQRPVAIKVLAPCFAGNGTARKRFAREARAAAAVVHQHVVPIHNVETDSDTPFLVMHYVAGESLQSRIHRSGALELVELLRIGVQVASGLAAAHQQGLVHRDIKPANILLEEDGVDRALLTDFGLARAADDVAMTRTGTHMGTPQYMSPEQVRAEHVDHKSDLFSLGSVLYTLCTGRPPFRSETSYGVMRSIIDEEPTPIRRLNIEVPEWFCRVVKTLMSKNPDHRFSTADETRAILEQCLNHVQNPASESLPTWLERPSRFSVRKALLPVTTVFVLIALFVAVVVFPKMSSEPENPRPRLSEFNGQKNSNLPTPINKNKNTTDPSVVTPAKNSRPQPNQENQATQEKTKITVEKIREYANQIKAAQKALHRGGGSDLFENLKNTKPSLRGWEYNFLNTLSKNLGKKVFERRQQLKEATSVYSVSFIPKSDKLVLASGKLGIIWDLKTEKKIKLEGHDSGVLCVAASPDGKKIVTGGWDGFVFVWDAKTGKRLGRFKGHNPTELRSGFKETAKVHSVSFSPDSKRVVSTAFPNSPFASRKCDIKIWSVEKLETQLELEGDHSTESRRSFVTCVAYSPNGKLIATGGYDHILRLWDAKTGTQLRTFKGHKNNVLGIDFSPDSTQVATASTDGTVVIWDVDTAKQLVQMTGHTKPVFSVKFSPDAKRIISGGYDHSVIVWEAKTGIELLTLDDLPGPIRSVSINDKGTAIASGGGAPMRNAPALVWYSNSLPPPNKSKGIQPPRRSVPYFKGMELYSWKNDKEEWMFSLVLGTNRIKSTVEIKNPLYAIRGIENLKAELRKQAPGEQIVWSQLDKGFELPSEKIQSQLKKFAKDLAISLD